MKAILRTAADLLSAPFAAFWTADEARRSLVGAAASDEGMWADCPFRTVSFDSGVIGEVARTRRVVNVADVFDDKRILGQEWFSQHGLTSFYGVPLVCQERILGVLNLVGRAPFRLDPDQEELLESFADQAAVAIRNAAVFAESERRRQAAESLAEVGRLLTQSLDVRVVAQRILDSVGQLVRSHSPSLYRLDPTGALVAVAVSSGVAGAIQEGLVFPPGTGMGGLAVRLRETVTSPNFLADPRVVQTPELRRRLEGAPYRALLSVPLMVKDQVIGVLSMGDREGRLFDEVDIHIAQAFADQAALALDNARLFEEAERRRKTAEALADVGRLVSQSLNLAEVAERITESVRSLLGVSNSALFEARLDAQELVSLCLKGDHGPGVRPIVYPIGYGAVGVAAKERRPIVTADLLDDPRIPQPPEQRARMEQAPFRAVLALPLSLQDRLVGVLVLGDRAGRVFSEEEVGIAQAFADQAAIAIENARLYTEATEQARQTKALSEVGRTLSETLDLDVVGQRITDRIRSLLSLNRATLFHLDPQTGDLTKLARAAASAAALADSVDQLPAGTGVAGRAVEDRTPVATADFLHDPRIRLAPVQQERLADSEHRAVLAVPLIAQDRVIGALSLGDRTGRVFNAEEIGLAQAFADQAAIAVENARLYSEATAQARQMKALSDIGRTLSETLDLDVVGQRITDSLRSLLSTYRASLYRLDRQTGDLIKVAGAAADAAALAGRADRLPAGTGVVGRATEDRMPVAATDFLDDPRIRPAPLQRERLATSEHRAILGLPLIARNRVIGALSVGDRTGRVFTAEEIGLAQAFADQAAIAVENARLFTVSERGRRAAEALAEVGKILAQSLDTEVVAQQIMDITGKLLGSDLVMLHRLDPASGDLIRAAVAKGVMPLLGQAGTLPRGCGVAGRAVQEQQPVVTTNLLEDPRIVLPPDMRTAIERAGYRSVLSVPLIVKGAVIGALSVGDREGRVFDAEEIGLAQAFADEAALALQNAEILQESRTRAHRLQTLLEVNRQLSMVQPIDTLLHAIAASAVALFGDCAGSLWVITDDGTQLTLAADAGLRHPECRTHVTFSIENSILGRAVREQRPIVIDDVQCEPPTLNSNRALAEAEGFHAMVVVPLLFGGRCYGTLSLRRRNHAPFRSDEVDLLASLASQAASAIENSQLYEGLREKNERLRELFEIAGRATVSLSLSDVIPTLVKAAAGLAGHDAACIRLLDPAGTRLLAVAHHGLSDTFAGRGPVAVGEGVAGQVVLDGQPMFIESLKDDRRHGHPEQALAEGIRAMAVVPLRSRDRNIGVLYVYARSQRRYREAEIELLSEFANVAAITIENAQLYEQAQVRAAGMKRLNQLGQLAGASLEAQRVLDFVVGAAGELLGSDVADLWVADETIDGVRLAATTDPVRPSVSPVRLGRGEGIAGWVIMHQKTYYTPDLSEDPFFVAKDWARCSGYKSMMAVPLMSEDKAVGALGIITRARRTFTADEEELLGLFAGKAALALVNARLYEAAQRALGELKAKNAELDSFVYSVSHDLKAPLVTIQGMASMLLADCASSLDERGQHYLRRIEANIGQMERLITDLLALSRVGREARPAELVALAEVADEVLASLAEPIRAGGVKVVRHELGSVCGVRTQLEQVFANLVGNAVKYLGDSPDPQVEIGAVGRDDCLECYVRDNGIGIDAAYHTQVFDLFQRLKEVPAEGSGVGLAIVKKIVEAAGGRVWVESAKGHGATFFFTWPTTTRPR